MPPEQIKERSYEVTLILDPTSDVYLHLEDPQREILDQPLFIQVQKDDDSGDYISFMFSRSGGSFNPLADYEALAGFVVNTQFHTLGWAPADLTMVANNDNTTLRSAS